MNRTLLLSTWLLTAAAALADASGVKPQAETAFDWGIWRRMVVHHQARLKPFDTAARETILEIAGRQEFRPEAFETISPAEIRDWVALQTFFRAPPKDAERAEPSEDGRTDRFKGQETGTANPKVRLRDLLTPGLRRNLRDVDFAKDIPSRRKSTTWKRNRWRSEASTFQPTPRFACFMNSARKRRKRRRFRKPSRKPKASPHSSPSTTNFAPNG